MAEHSNWILSEQKGRHRLLIFQRRGQERVLISLDHCGPLFRLKLETFCDEVNTLKRHLFELGEVEHTIDELGVKFLFAWVKKVHDGHSSHQLEGERTDSPHICLKIVTVSKVVFWTNEVCGSTKSPSPLQFQWFAESQVTKFDFNIFNEVCFFPCSLFGFSIFHHWIMQQDILWLDISVNKVKIRVHHLKPSTNRLQDILANTRSHSAVMVNKHLPQVTPVTVLENEVVGTS